MPPRSGDQRTQKQIEHAERLAALSKKRAKDRKQAVIDTLGVPPTPDIPEELIGRFEIEPQPEPVLEPDPVPVNPTAPAADPMLAQLANLFAAASADTSERKAKLVEIERVLGSMGNADYKELLGNPTVQAFVEQMAAQSAEMHPDDPPGTIYNRGQLNEHKRPWQWRDLPKFFPAPPAPDRVPGDIETREVTPIETLVITWNGLAYPIVSGVTQWIPLPHFLVYQERRRAMAAADQHLAMIYGDLKVVTADPTIVSQSTGFVRGHGRGTFIPAGGGWDTSEQGEA